MAQSNDSITTMVLDVAELDPYYKICCASGLHCWTYGMLTCICSHKHGGSRCCQTHFSEHAYYRYKYPHVLCVSNHSVNYQVSALVSKTFPILVLFASLHQCGATITTAPGACSTIFSTCTCQLPNCCPPETTYMYYVHVQKH